MFNEIEIPNLSNTASKTFLPILFLQHVEFNKIRLAKTHHEYGYKKFTDEIVQKLNTYDVNHLLSTVNDLIEEFNKVVMVEAND